MVFQAVFEVEWCLDDAENNMVDAE
jgi:hypothetical protein